jgi:mannose-1-phosphate guanylyltransferase
MIHALIMAGGSGTRLWPLSRKNTPKQALALLEERSMFRVTAERLAPLIPLERVWVVTNAEMAEVFQRQVPGIPASNYVLEPGPRDSGPAAGLGLAHVYAADPDATVAILSADHHIADVEGFRDVLARAARHAEGGGIVTLGIRPTHASTGFGYIERGDDLGGGIYAVLRFTEKPPQDVARAYLEGGRHSWNSGMFIMTAATGLAEFERQHPAFAADLRELQAFIGTAGYEGELARRWPQAPKLSIDYAIMEGAREMAVVPVDIGWSDIGSWTALFEALGHDESGNAVQAEHFVAIDTRDSLVRSSSGRLIATVGLEGVVVVDTPDALLVCALDRTQDVKRIVDELKRRSRIDLV